MSPSRARRLVLACCIAIGLSLVLVGAAGIGAGSFASLDGSDGASASASTAVLQPQDADGIDLPERLDLTSLSAEGSAEVRTDASPAIHRDGSALGAAFDQHLLQAQLDRAPTETGQREVVESALSDSNETIVSLREREESVREAYQDGEIDAAELSTELAAIHERSERELQRLERIGTATDERDVQEFDDEIVVLRAQALHRQGMIREQVSSLLAAEAPARDVFVASGGEGVVLATIDGDDYYREANRADAQVANTEPGIGPNEAWELKDELYPAFTSDYGFTSMPPLANDHLYQPSADYEHGELRTFIDAHSEEVVREEQHLRLDHDLPTADTVTTNEGNVTLALNRTYPSGPAMVTVYDDEEPVEGATITVGGDEAGETDEEGDLWVILPYEEPVVETTYDGTTTNTTVDWSSAGVG